MTASWTPEGIRAIRHALGETQLEFAEHFQLHVESIRVWEQGRGPPSGPSHVILKQLSARCKRKARADR